MKSCVTWALRCLDAECLKFFDDTPSVAMPHTLNNPQDLNADYLMIRFPVEALIS